MDKKPLTYKDAGVDVNEGARAVELMKHHVKKTFTRQVLCDLGGFGGLFELDLTGYEKPVLVSGTDGVGTKLKLAFLMDRHDTVGQDCVAMCVNDILCQGAKPLFFLDYVATGKLEPEKVADIVKGISDGCVQAGCALIGGETAEMPGFYGDGEYDMAGFAVGIVDKSKIIDGSKIKAGDVLIGLPSSGIHSNGYSMVRKLFFDGLEMTTETFIDELNSTLGEILLKPTRIYVDVCTSLLEKHEIKGMVHITGGGFYENIPRILPQGMGVKIELGSWKVLPIFQLIQKYGQVAEEEMFATFNMGIGMILAVNQETASKVMADLENQGEEAYIIGSVVADQPGVTLWRP
ncbi:MAG: phosphoribosylformylglycinamidine cyclo-ligase [Anaerosolibacter sp.]|jgi:phosphoribosylformylglycinamidine cyclo-ligase|uniref:phosphoribosylformylglycinamidine cyclo-ligase n=1 Tax=Anaerosolibacter sp. TaxID=1872527 RepID=UPI00261CDC86|nr:phosphoribosylformylglycinamidine cyclo-ligase [Anaerosolibacter sp.]MDF2546695.1 phosphoribosylformylglycinamidine cyclo-ligase [Anaerosolibacter sp.]